MTESEARSKIKYRLGIARQIAGNGVDGKSFEEFEIALQALKEIREYRELGTVEELQELKEKATPKKDSNDGARCRNCGTYNNFITDNLFNPKGHPVVYCWNCGQAIEWE